MTRILRQMWKDVTSERSKEMAIGAMWGLIAAGWFGLIIYSPPAGFSCGFALIILRWIRSANRRAP